MVKRAENSGKKSPIPSPCSARDFFGPIPPRSRKSLHNFQFPFQISYGLLRSDQAHSAQTLITTPQEHPILHPIRTPQECCIHYILYIYNQNMFYIYKKWQHKQNPFLWCDKKNSDSSTPSPKRPPWQEQLHQRQSSTNISSSCIKEKCPIKQDAYAKYSQGFFTPISSSCISNHQQRQKIVCCICVMILKDSTKYSKHPA